MMSRRVKVALSKALLRSAVVVAAKSGDRGLLARSMTHHHPLHFFKEGGGGGGESSSFASTTTRFFSSSCSTSSSSKNENATVSMNNEEERRKRLINKMLYRAKQRGFLELDVVVGEWAERNLNAKTTSDAFLSQFAMVLDEENPDLYSYLTGQSEAPKYLREENEAYKELKAHVMKFLDEKSDEKTRAKFGKEWVRGWNDGGGGNQ